MNGRLRLRVTRTAESIVRAGHPWLYAESIRDQNRPGELGELAVIYDRNDRFLAIGIYDPESPLRVRILHAGKPVQLTPEWWSTRLRQALDRRAGLFDAATSGFRWVHGESDGWPGLVLDRYDQTLVLKLYTAAWLPRLNEVLGLVTRELNPNRVVLRLSRNIQELATRRFQHQDGDVLSGPPVDEPVRFRETGLQFEAEVVKGQKTGFFLDQRENRRKVEALAEGRDVLNVFSFSGGFSLYASRGGARSVTDVDMSPHALEAARRNFALNRTDPRIRAIRHETVQADAFDWLQRAESQYDFIILDPPSLARRETEKSGALQAYRKLAGSALPRLRPGGILLAASCSAHVSAREFFQVLREVAGSVGRPFAELTTSGQPADHPATFPEAEYLKAIYIQFPSAPATPRMRKI